LSGIESVASRFDIVYHCDSKPEIGNGHLKRGLDVLHSLRVRNPELKLALCGDYSDSAVQFINMFIHPAIKVHHLPVPLPMSRVAILDTMHRSGDPSFMDPSHASSVKASGDRFVIISSSLEISLPVKCDLFIDHLPDVEFFGEQPAEKHLGFKYAPVSNEFFAPINEHEHARPDHLVAVVGGGIVQNGPEKLAEAFYDRALDEFAGFVIVLSPHFPAERVKEIELRYPQIELMQGIPSLAPLLHSAAAVICTYGNITYESLSCGKATFVANYLDFQNEYATYLEQKGMVYNLGSFDSLDRISANHLFNPMRRNELTTRVNTEFNGSGIEAISDSLLQQLKAK
jgi:spore coat polysaccharide biosynthesis predicted glycosyltransferase SpsG